MNLGADSRRARVGHAPAPRHVIVGEAPGRLAHLFPESARTNTSSRSQRRAVFSTTGLRSAPRTAASRRARHVLARLAECPIERDRVPRTRGGSPSRSRNAPCAARPRSGPNFPENQLRLDNNGNCRHLRLVREPERARRDPVRIPARSNARDWASSIRASPRFFARWPQSHSTTKVLMD